MSSPLPPLHAIGIMTGNSLDAVDVVLTAFGEDGSIQDLSFHSESFPEELQHDIRRIRGIIHVAEGDMAAALEKAPGIDSVIRRYTECVAGAVNMLIRENKGRYEVDVIGFHGQTCAHRPPSMTPEGEEPYTIQIGDGQLLADLTGITTIYDFRSDDLMQKGEGAPLAPIHNQHIAEQLGKKGYFPITFINAGNTSNIAHITLDASGELVTCGWDAGPCNHFPDLLTRTERGMLCDKDGNIGRQGRIHIPLLHALFHYAATTPQKENFLAKKPPKSSDPQFYQPPDMLLDKTLAFEDRLRTAEYFSAYLLFHSLGYTSEAIQLPSRFALFGGGWKNPVVLEHFRSLLQSDFSQILPEHAALFHTIRERLHRQPVTVSGSGEYGFDGQAMEARIFADMARCRITGEAFTTPQTTGCSEGSLCGIIRYPSDDSKNTTAHFRAWQQAHAVTRHPIDDPGRFDGRWSRAAAGWSKEKDVPYTTRQLQKVDRKSG